jgi:hypothetical protein
MAPVQQACVTARTVALWTSNPTANKAQKTATPPL